MFAAINLFVIAVVITVVELVSLLSPLVVFAATELVKKVSPKISGWILVMLIVPLLSVAVAWVTEILLVPGLSFWAQFGYGLLAVFVNELFKQLKIKG
jgi:hypothetical protein